MAEKKYTGADLAKVQPMKDVRAILEQYSHTIEKYITGENDVNKKEKAQAIINDTILTLRESPGLQKATPMSLLGAIYRVVRIGLSPNKTFGHAYLVPRKNKQGQTEVEFQLGYKGMKELAMRTGKIKSIISGIVKENDIWEFDLLSGTMPKHIPAAKNRGAMIQVYAIVKYTNGEIQIEVMNAEEVEHVKNTSAQGTSSDFSPWNTYPDQMAEKTVVRKLLGKASLDDGLQKVITLDEASDDANLRQNNAVEFSEYEEVAVEEVDAQIVEEDKAVKKEQAKEKATAKAKATASNITKPKSELFE